MSRAAKTLRGIGAVLQVCSKWATFRSPPERYFTRAVPRLRQSKTRSKFIKPVVVSRIKSSKQVVEVYSEMTVSELAATVGQSDDDLMELLVDIDPKNIDLLSKEKILDKELIMKVVSAYDLKPRLVSRPAKQTEDSSELDDDITPLPPPPESECKKRAPVITIMGHVDHGKTTLLDCLRKSRIVETEFGGITQHIGAFTLSDGENSMTFIDTPGHAAFAQMRQRGASSTDIVVLVVAADDGVKEQTVQSIKYAREAGVPIIVAINKCDRPNADPANAKRSLLAHNIVVEDLHGDVLSADISALHGTNIDALKNAILLQAADMNLRSTWKGPVEGVVIESSTSKGVGKVCTMIVQRGTLKKGSILVAGTSWARVRLMNDENGRVVTDAGPSSPVRVAGWRDELPTPGEKVYEVENENRAQRVVAHRIAKEMERKAEKDWKAIETVREEERKKYLASRQQLLDSGRRWGSTTRIISKKDEASRKEEGAVPSLKLMIHSDVDGTLEAILDVLDSYSSQKVDLQLVDVDVGPPCERDIEIAVETGATIYCFNVQVDSKIKRIAEHVGVQILNFNVIYRLVEDLKNRLSACLPDVETEKLVGEGRVLKEFLISDRGRKKQPIAGTLIKWGNFSKSCKFRFLRGNTVFYEGPIVTMKREKEVVSSAKTGEEVGISLDDKKIRFEEDDSVEVIEMVSVKQTIDWNPPGF